jgi:hypothetical protein
MPPPAGLSESEMGSWIFRIGIGVIGFFLCLGVKDAKKQLDAVPGLVATIAAMKEAQDALFRRVEALETESRSK